MLRELTHVVDFGGGKLDLGGLSIVCRDSGFEIFRFRLEILSVGWGNSLNPIRIALGVSAALKRLQCTNARLSQRDGGHGI